MVKAKKEYFRKEIEQSSRDQRATWNVLNELKTELGSIFHSERIAECLNNHFVNVGIF